MLTHVVTWKWQSSLYRERFQAEHVNALLAAFEENLERGHRFLCVTDDPSGVACETYPLWDDHRDVPNLWSREMPSCYRRLKIFDPKTQRAMGISAGDSVVSVDLDVVVTDGLDRLLDRTERFVGWETRGTVHPRVFNGTIFMLRAGELSDVWEDFDPARSPRLAHRSGYYGSDQGWLSYRLAAAEAGWKRDDGIRSYLRDVRHARRLPEGTRLLSFNGRHKPWHPDVQRQLPWLARYWRT